MEDSVSFASPTNIDMESMMERYDPPCQWETAAKSTSGWHFKAPTSPSRIARVGAVIDAPRSTKHVVSVQHHPWTKGRTMHRQATDRAQCSGSYKEYTV
eukprot:scaffold24525_cov162-Cylindrotheca_fusiformis.AAC.6